MRFYQMLKCTLWMHRFNCEHSLQSLIQSRGRASRARSSKYISICKSESEANKLARSQDQEVQMLKVIQLLAQAPNEARYLLGSPQLKSLDMITETQAPGKQTSTA